MKKKLLVTSLLFSLLMKAQIGIKTSNPKATLEVAASPNDLTKIDGIIPPKLKVTELMEKDDLYTSDQTGAIVYVTETTGLRTPITINISEPGYYYFDGTVWQKLKINLTGQNGLTHNGSVIKLGGNLNENTTIGTSASNTLKVTGLQTNISSDKLLMIGNDGTMRQGDVTNVFVPQVAVISLVSDRTNFLNGIGPGGSQVISNMSLVQNGISGLSFNSTNSNLTLPKGTYQIMVTYEANHNNTCTLSSYFVQFPTDTGTKRIHTTASHLGSGLSNHGGSITYTTVLTFEKVWPIELGRGQSGSCSGSGMTLNNGSTQVTIFQLKN